jgi:AbrB family looped-hinge helix DNA binding protein
MNSEKVAGKWSKLPEREAEEEAVAFIACVTSKGNVTIPSDTRALLGITPGTFVKVSVKKVK